MNNFEEKTWSFNDVNFVQVSIYHYSDNEAGGIHRLGT